MEELDFCRSLPKVELHAHLNGSISEETIARLVELHRRRGWSETSPLPEKWQVVIEKGGSRTLDEGFLIFKLIHQLTRDEEAVQLVTESVIKDFAKDNCRYLELRSGPRAVPGTGMTRRSYVEAMLNGIRACQEEKVNCNVRLILSIDRSRGAQVAEEVVTLAEEFRQSSSLVVGVDLSGDPKAGKAEDFLPVLKRAKASGLKLAVHLAEVANIEESRALLEVGVDRIGHGTCLQTKRGGSDDLVEKVRRDRTVLELCLSSNVKCRTVDSYSDHHIIDWHDFGQPYCICTDDKGVFATTLSEELAHATSILKLSRRQLADLSKQAVNYAFVDEDEKKHLRTLFDGVIADLSL